MQIIDPYEDRKEENFRFIGIAPGQISEFPRGVMVYFPPEKDIASLQN